MLGLDNDTNMNELFNPSEFTEKELLKLVYRELHNLRTEFDEYRKNNTTQKELSDMQKHITALETEVAINKRIQADSEKRHSRNLAYAGIVVSVVMFILKFVIR